MWFRMESFFFQSALDFVTIKNTGNEIHIHKSLVHTENVRWQKSYWGWEGVWEEVIFLYRMIRLVFRLSTWTPHIIRYEWCTRDNTAIEKFVEEWTTKKEPSHTTTISCVFMVFKMELAIDITQWYNWIGPKQWHLFSWLYLFGAEWADGWSIQSSCRKQTAAAAAAQPSAGHVKPTPIHFVCSTHTRTVGVKKQKARQDEKH